MSRPNGLRVFLLGASGTIGRATLQALAARGHSVVAFGRAAGLERLAAPAGVERRSGDVCDAASLAREGFRGERFDALVSCLASRTGAPRDAWAIDHAAHRQALQAAGAAGVTRVVLLSAICVQKPRLAFQQAKLAFERELMASGLDWSIVRPTAYFKSLSGQVARVRAGKPFLAFGDGTLTACKPIADEDLGAFLADCLTDPERRNRVLPIGGPGPAITPREQAERLFAMLGRPMRLRTVPVALLDGIVRVLGTAARVLPALEAKAEFARIGRYYATESMLVWDEQAGRYDAQATPSFGTRTLWDHYAALLRGETTADLGEHAVF
jgi:divinyl chlorophyllide a 8-vinyl-reductase